MSICFFFLVTLTQLRKEANIILIRYTSMDRLISTYEILQENGGKYLNECFVDVSMCVLKL